MTTPSLLHQIEGPFTFFRPEPEELRALFPDAERALPLPGASFLEDEAATPLTGFPVLLSPGFVELRMALDGYLSAEEEAQMAVVQRRSLPRQSYNAAWERYRALLTRAVENVTISSYGRNFPAIFWLQHSLDAARRIKEVPRRLVRLDLALGRQHGDLLKYKVLERYLDRVVTETYDLAHRMADDTEDVEEELFPRLLTRMRDNVLLFSEDHVSADLGELASYFHGYLRLDGRDLLRRVEALAAWSAERLAADPSLRETVRHLLAPPAATPGGASDPSERARELFVRSGWARYLASRPDYPADRLLPPPLVKVWEGLLIKLKEFELIHALRRYLLPVRRESDAYVCRSGIANRVAGRGELRLSPATRPLDFLASWVVDPLVHRFGLIYDLTDFSEIVNVLRRSGSDVQDDSFRRMFRFQRRLNRIAGIHKMKLEKYLGDGAFYSSRHAAAMVVGALQLQRAYRQALAEGFSFDRGMRLAMNFGQYRLIPIASGGRGEADRYEFFGHGLVELSRLISGKASREFEEMKTTLVAHGYPEATVYRFFSPLLARNQEAIGPPAGRTYYATINANGNLVNEGIVATEAFVAQLADELGPDAPVWRAREGELRFAVAAIESAGARVLVGVRRMGLAHLKGLDRVPVYEIVDGEGWAEEVLGPPATAGLLDVADQEATIISIRGG